MDKDRFASLSQSQEHLGSGFDSGHSYNTLVTIDWKMNANSNFDIVVYGAYGFTGKLVCEFLSQNYNNVKWAIAGRDKKCLEEVRSKFNLNEKIGTFVVDSKDQEGLRNMASQTKVVLDTAGPFAVIGLGIVEACVQAGCNYCDITGEPTYIRQVIDRFHEEAERKKLKIVNCCGFDCVPADLGTHMMVEAMKEQHITPKGVVFMADESKGSVSVGTLTSILMLFEKNSIGELLRMLSPFYLNPRDRSQQLIRPNLSFMKLWNTLDSIFLGYDFSVNTWTAPYIMQVIDTRIVNRSNAISGWSYGEAFVYYERMKAKNFMIAAIISIVMMIMNVFLLVPPVRMIMKLILPRLDRGPNQDLLDHGFFGMKMVGLGTDQKSGNSVKIFGSIFAEHGDPGYRQTAKMVCESAICLAKDSKRTPQTFGVLTPSVAFGAVLRQRLIEKGIDFTVEQRNS